MSSIKYNSYENNSNKNEEIKHKDETVQYEWGDDNYNRFMTPKFENILAEASESYYHDKEKGHDKLFKEVLSNKADFKNFITDFVDKKLGNIIKTDDIELYNAKFITTNFLQVESDLIYKVINKPVYFVIEHQSTIDNNMPYRILVYVTELIKEHMAMKEKVERTISNSNTNCYKYSR